MSSQRIDVSASINPVPSSLLFETEKSPPTETTVPTIIKAIQDASSLDNSGALPPDAAKAFSQFVSIIQQAKRTDILTTYAQVKSGAGFKNKDTAKYDFHFMSRLVTTNNFTFWLHYRSVFWDGLITAGTPATVETAATLLINNEMPADEVSKFLMCLSFVKHPTEETLLIVSVNCSLLKKKKKTKKCPPQNKYLSTIAPSDLIRRSQCRRRSIPRCWSFSEKIRARSPERRNYCVENRLE